MPTTESTVSRRTSEPGSGTTLVELKTDDVERSRGAAEYSGTASTELEIWSTARAVLIVKVTHWYIEGARLPKAIRRCQFYSVIRVLRPLVDIYAASAS